MYRPVGVKAEAKNTVKNKKNEEKIEIFLYPGGEPPGYARKTFFYIFLLRFSNFSARSIGNRKIIGCLEFSVMKKS